MEASFPVPAKQVLWRYVAAILIASVLPFVLWPPLITKIISADFMPHRFCYLNTPGLIWANVIPDALIGVAYVAISATLARHMHGCLSSSASACK